MSEHKTSDLLQRSFSGDRAAKDALMLDVYAKLHTLAEELLRHETPAHTLQPTALVHEAYLKMVGQDQVDWQGRTHFYAISARMMRRILVDHARGKKRDKRGGGLRRVLLTADMSVSNRNHEDVLAIEDALVKLEKLEPRQAHIVELRFFGGLSVAEVAAALGVSKRTVESDWTMVRAWLRREFSESNES